MIITTIALVSFYIMFQLFWNGFIFCMVINLAEKENLSIWKAWEAITLDEEWTGFKGLIVKCYYFIPAIAAWISKIAKRTSKESIN